MKKGILVVLLALALLLVFTWFPWRDWMVAGLEWGQRRPDRAALLFVVVCVAATVILVPGWIFMVLAGYLFGWMTGAALASLGSLLGALAAFLIGRNLARANVEQRAQSMPRFHALDRAISGSGFTIVLLTRLCMVIPYNLLNYVYGVTSATPASYALGTWLGMLPVVLLYSYLGTTARNIAALLDGDLETGVAGRLLMVVAAIALTALVLVIVGKTRRILGAELDQAA